MDIYGYFQKTFYQILPTHSTARDFRNCNPYEPETIYYHGKVQVRKKYELVGSHTARRSGATELARRNVPIATISKLMNHTNTNVTSRYIFADTRNLGEEAMSFFNEE